MSMYTEEQLLEAKAESFKDGAKHRRPSDETITLIEENRNYVKELIEKHELREVQNYKELKKLFEDHVNETAELNKTLILLLNGSKFLKSLFSGLVGLVIGLGVLITASVKFVEWLRK